MKRKIYETSNRAALRSGAAFSSEWRNGQSRPLDATSRCPDLIK